VRLLPRVTADPDGVAHLSDEHGARSRTARRRGRAGRVRTSATDSSRWFPRASRLPSKFDRSRECRRPSSSTCSGVRRHRATSARRVREQDNERTGQTATAVRVRPARSSPSGKGRDDRGRHNAIGRISGSRISQMTSATRSGRMQAPIVPAARPD
jgi:hypothetical protein